MKKRLVFLFILILLLQSCSSLKSTIDKEQKALLVKAKVEAFDFTFVPFTGHSNGFFLTHLSPDYTFKVSKDSLKSYLPFFGRAYVAPMNSTDGGIKFISTDFERKLILGKKPGNWIIKFKTLDTPLPLELLIDVWDNGTAHLVVNDPNRQSMSFDGALDF